MDYRRMLRFSMLILVASMLGGCQLARIQQAMAGSMEAGSEDASGKTQEIGDRKVLDMNANLGLEQVASRVAPVRVIYVGETHDDYADHLTQLELIRRLHAKNPDLAIGMEQFQQPFQEILDGYIDGQLDEKDLIRKTEWMDRWKFDYRLYRPILSFAREHRIPVIALNVSKEIVAKVSKDGFEGLSQEDKAKVPADIDYSDEAYHNRLKSIYEKHAHSDKKGFDRFLQVQLLWDEGMAQRAADYLKTNPERQLVVLAGSGHLMYGSGIPQRVSRRVKAERAIILPAGDFTPVPGVGDYIVHDVGEKLPPKGFMGIYLAEDENGVKVEDLVKDGSAIKAGVKKNDLIRTINGQTIKTITDLKLTLMDEGPGTEVNIGVTRKALLQKEKNLELKFPLGN